MRWLVLALACACGGGSGRKAAFVEPAPPAPPVVVEWKVEQGDGSLVNVALVVDGKAHELGALDAATEFEPGTPATCALRAASPRRTELVCGDKESLVADLIDPSVQLETLAHWEVRVSRIGAGEPAREVKRIPVGGETFAVKMLVLPGSKL